MNQDVGYTRRSTGKQENSIAAQMNALSRWAVQNSVDLELVEETRSACDATHRPVFQSILAGVRAGHVRRIVVSKLDRLFRSEMDSFRYQKELADAGCTLLSLAEGEIQDSAAGVLQFGVASVVAAFERRRISERTIDGLDEIREQGRCPVCAQELRLLRGLLPTHETPTGEACAGRQPVDVRGKRLGLPPLGYRREADGSQVEDPEEMRTVQAIVTLREGGSSLRQIAQIITKMHVPTPRPKSDKEGRGVRRSTIWAHTTVALVLRRYAEEQAARQV
jgi:predicted site-specific integrase-resolvase